MELKTEAAEKFIIKAMVIIFVVGIIIGFMVGVAFEQRRNKAEQLQSLTQ